MLQNTPEKSDSVSDVDVNHAFSSLEEKSTTCFIWTLQTVHTFHVCYLSLTQLFIFHAQNLQNVTINTGWWGKTHRITHHLRPCSVCDSNDTWQRERKREREMSRLSLIPTTQGKRKARESISRSPYHRLAELCCITSQYGYRAALPRPITPSTPDAQRRTLTSLRHPARLICSGEITSTVMIFILDEA